MESTATPVIGLVIRPEGRVHLRCAECGTPWAEVQNGTLIVKSRHRGETHINAISAVDLLAIICQPGELEQILNILYQLQNVGA